MTTRIPACFARCAAEGRPALVTYTMAGDPDLATVQAIFDRGGSINLHSGLSGVSA